MEYLQYGRVHFSDVINSLVLNLIINGIPSILSVIVEFKNGLREVLNLIINGIPSIHGVLVWALGLITLVLNLIINGIPSIPSPNIEELTKKLSFKPYYKWNTFNTKKMLVVLMMVLSSFKPYYKWNTFNT